MKRITASLLCMAALTACTDGSGSGSIGSGGELENVPDDLKGNVEAVSYNANNETLTLRLNGLDGGPQDLVYTRNAALDVDGYEAYTYQDDPLDRHFTALVAQSNDGSVIAGAVADGGQFNRYFGGGFYQRSGRYDPPTGASGQVSYAGTYAGVTNLDAPGDDLLPTPAGTDPAILPAQSARVEGDIFLNVSFNDNAVNGGVYNRRFIDDQTITLPDVVLVNTTIDEEGVFYGEVEFDGTINGVGNYGGIFGGTDAAAVGGTVVLEDIDNNIYGWTGDEEIGVFVLTQCGQAGDADQCDDVN
ncbi:thymidylate synthase [Thalassobius sp. S69A]|uniref:thymidylate synthase n=1 Tax=unclassified Thalassovita TaxID=2619711 RepID=UPI000C5CC845|nr:thymidylate synthase [Paracoccaceae bacterium]